MSNEKRLAISAQTPPTGDGEIVLDVVIDKVDRLIHLQSEASLSIVSIPGLQAIREDLIARAEIGEKKYGTKLRIKNGRRAIVDLYQEIMDGIMYSAQARIEGDEQGGQYVEILIQVASQIAAELDKR